MANNANFFQLVANAASVNQGAYGKPIHWKRIRALIMVPVSYYLTPADLAGIKTKLQADAIVTDPYSRIQIVGILAEGKDASSAPKKLSYGYGQERQVYPGQYAGEWMFADADLAKQQRRQAFNDRAEEFLCYLADEAYNIIGTKGDDGSNNVTHRGFTLNDYQAMNNTLDMGDGAKNGVYVSFADSTEFNQGNLMVINAGFNIWNNIKCVADVKLVQASALSTRVVSIALIVEGGEIGTNLAEKYATVLAANPTYMKCQDHSNGTLIAATGAVAATLAGQAVITYTFSATGFPSSGGQIDLYVDTPAAGAVLGLKYFETPQKLPIAIP